jgi:hypothetical protein
MPKHLAPIHPGETLLEDVLKPLNMSVNQLAKSLAVDAARLNEIGRGRFGESQGNHSRSDCSASSVFVHDMTRAYDRCWVSKPP